ncbi:MAG: carboxypeptidase regulatory-like domain-containing protein [Labilithrix sp.]|nr:carboxypeptidase regulatory-like domain-containing protein [Labilithrix sp.]
MKTTGTLVLSLLLLGGAAGTALAQENGTVTFGGGASTQTGAAATAAPQTTEGEPADRAADPDKDWAARESKLNEGMTLNGGVGLIHTQHAQGGATGQFRVDFTTEYFSAGFLCTREFPCRDPRNPNNVIQSDSADHIGGRLRLSMQVVKWLDTYLATSALANSNPANRPSLLQVLGDSTFGAKAHGQLSNVFHVGGAFELWLVNGTGAVGLDGAGTSAKFRGLATADLRGADKPIPLRISTNLTYVLDNSGEVVAATETARGAPITRIERFGLNVNRVDHFDIHLGAELFAAQEKVRPFLEYHVLIPVNRQDYRCRQNNPSSDKCLATDPFAPSTLTLGSRFYPWKKGFNLTAALDIGVSGVGTFIEEMRPTPPWMLYLGAGWAFDTQDKPPVIQERVVERGRPAGRRIRGFVHEEGKAEGIGGAIVAWENHPELTSLATGTDGRFTTHDLPAGPYVFAVQAEGYKPGQCSTTIAAPAAAPGQAPAPEGGDVQLDCVLEALPRVGNIVGKVKDLDTGLFVGGAAIKVVDVAKKELSGSTDGQGAFRFELVTPGEASITVDAEGYLVSSEQLDVKVRQDNPIEISVKKKPKNPLVALQSKEIVIRQQVQFGVDSAVILPASTGLLTEIADVLLKNPRIRRVEVQGHTDGTGAPGHNQKLSEDRASAVVAWLTAHGVAADRLTAKGYGDSKPLVPNVTELNKQRNRRVQFIITEQDPAAAAPGPLGAPALGAPALGTGAKAPAPKN